MNLTTHLLALVVALCADIVPVPGPNPKTILPAHRPTCPSPGSGTEITSPQHAVCYAPDQVVVRFRTGISEQGIASFCVQEKLRVIRPVEVQVYSIDRLPPLSRVFQVPRERLEEVAARIRSEVGTKAVA
ncbi:MAG: hypothetical protein ABIK62_01915, partial [candidate division WOR-3 bacterium]